MLAMLLAVGVFIGALYLYKKREIEAAIAAGAAFEMPPTAVTSYTTQGVAWEPVIKAVGSLKAVQGVDVSSDLSGIVTEIAFESGKPIKKGELLLKLDTKQEEAQLKAAIAAARLSKVNVDRQRELLSRRATSQSEYDTAVANADQAEANVDQVRAVIARKTILAPFDGVLGIRKVNIGQYLDVGKPIVTLESQDPIYVEFALPQQELSRITLGRKVRVMAAGIEGKEFAGEITAINSKVDESTRNIALEATLSNQEHLLRGGMFVNVEVVLPKVDGVIVVPASAIVYGPIGESVFVIEKVPAADGKPESLRAVQKFVKTGASRGDQVAVEKGLHGGEEIVSAGAFKLTSGAPVVINNSVLPENEENPQPPET